MTIYKFAAGLSHILHPAELIVVIQLILSKLWIKKYDDKKVTDHLQILVVVVRAYESSYSLSSSLISFQNQSDKVINNEAIFVINRAKSYSPINKIKLIKNKIDIFQ